MVEIHNRARSRTRHAIITAAHNCRRNFEVVYGFICGRGTQEDSTCYPVFDLVVSVLPIESLCSRDANSVDGTYANFIGQLPISIKRFLRARLVEVLRYSFVGLCTKQ